ncbi:hypothetical protein GCM10009741_29170 [Kribbella lupini]|uniref:Uncharacterized protein n=1 Tax=Kribbella lupini TaxID=291602 RepID=A0ABP4LJZ8_9ACTN
MLGGEVIVIGLRSARPSADGKAVEALRQCWSGRVERQSSKRFDQKVSQSVAPRERTVKISARAAREP